jgi:hypothetical protein
MQDLVKMQSFPLVPVQGLPFGSVARGTALAGHSDFDYAVVLRRRYESRLFNGSFHGGEVLAQLVLEELVNDGSLSQELRPVRDGVVQRESLLRQQKRSMGLLLSKAGTGLPDVDMVFMAPVSGEVDQQSDLSEHSLNISPLQLNPEDARTLAQRMYAVYGEGNECIELPVTVFKYTAVLKETAASRPWLFDMIRLVKRWNYGWGSPLQSFHLERIVRALAAVDLLLCPNGAHLNNKCESCWSAGKVRWMCGGCAVSLGCVDVLVCDRTLCSNAVGLAGFISALRGVQRLMLEWDNPPMCAYLSMSVFRRHRAEFALRKSLANATMGAWDAVFNPSQDTWLECMALSSVPHEEELARAVTVFDGVKSLVHKIGFGEGTGATVESVERIGSVLRGTGFAGFCVNIVVIVSMESGSTRKFSSACDSLVRSLCEQEWVIRELGVIPAPFIPDWSTFAVRLPYSSLAAGQPDVSLTFQRLDSDTLPPKDREFITSVLQQVSDIKLFTSTFLASCSIYPWLPSAVRTLQLWNSYAGAFDEGFLERRLCDLVPSKLREWCSVQAGAFVALPAEG